MANILFAEKIIHSRVKEEIQVQTLTRSQKCDSLLNAVERQIIADPSKFCVLVEVLQREYPTQFIAQQLLNSKQYSFHLMFLKFYFTSCVCFTALAEISKHSGAPECQYQPTAISGQS